MVNLQTEIPVYKAIEKRWNKEYLVEFRWEDIHTLQIEDFTFPIDKKVFSLLSDIYRKM
jgi:hypothetical protein